MTNLKRKNKPQTNIEFVTDLMEFSQYGALAQLFVIVALDEWSKVIANAPVEKLGNAMINGEAWQGVAKEIQAKLAARR